nr:hypothetical protein GCM10025732_29730 [Glycomyces mayteni]
MDVQHAVTAVVDQQDVITVGCGEERIKALTHFLDRLIDQQLYVFEGEQVNMLVSQRVVDKVNVD